MRRGLVRAFFILGAASVGGCAGGDSSPHDAGDGGPDSATDSAFADAWEWDAAGPDRPADAHTSGDADAGGGERPDLAPPGPVPSKPCGALGSGDAVALAFSPDGSLLVSAGRAGIIRVLRTADWTEARFLYTTPNVNEIAISPDGRLVAAAGQGGKVTVWTLADGKELYSFPADSEAVWALAFSPDGRRLATAGQSENAIRI